MARPRVPQAPPVSPEAAALHAEVARHRAIVEEMKRVGVEPRVLFDAVEELQAAVHAAKDAPAPPPPPPPIDPDEPMAHATDAPPETE